MTSKWTPGPWKNTRHIVKALSHGKWFTVASAQKFGFTEEGATANARLIAAAPELAEAARDAYLHLCLMATGQHTPKSNAEIVEMLGAALAKLDA